MWTLLGLPGKEKREKAKKQEIRRVYISNPSIKVYISCNKHANKQYNLFNCWLTTYNYIHNLYTNMFY